MNEDTQEALRSLIRDLLGMPKGSVRPADENQPTEGDNYAIMQVTEMNPQGWAGESEDAYQSGIATITLDFMGEKSGVYARNLNIALQSFYAVNILMGLNLGLLECRQAINLSAAEIERIKRYRVTLLLSYAFKYDRPDIVNDATGSIDNININLIGEP